jgi:hypothetical protein
MSTTTRRQIGRNTNREGQIAKAIELIAEMREINPEWVEERRAEMNGRWTQGTCTFEYVSDQITAMIDAKRASRQVSAHQNVPMVSSGRYAFGEEGNVKYYRVVNDGGSYNVFRYQSDTQHQMTAPIAILNVLRAIARDTEPVAALRWATGMKRCWACGKKIHDESNPYYSQGLGPDCGKKG